MAITIQIISMGFFPKIPLMMMIVMMMMMVINELFYYN